MQLGVLAGPSQFPQLRSVYFLSRELPSYPAPEVDLLDRAAAPKRVERTQDPFDEIGPQLPIALGIESLISHRRYRNVIGGDSTLRSHGVKTSASELAVPEVFGPALPVVFRQDMIGFDFWRKQVQHHVEMNEIRAQPLDLALVMNDQPGKLCPLSRSALMAISGIHIW
jgi:hypothetical protein